MHCQDDDYHSSLPPCGAIGASVLLALVAVMEAGAMKEEASAAAMVL